MKTSFIRWTSRAAASAMAALLALAALLVPAAAAHALPSGTSWAGSWDYYTANAFQYTATLPGVKLTGYGTDHSGTRTTLGSIQDTADDGRCARVQLYANGVGYIADKTTCSSGSSLSYATNKFYEGLLVVVYRMLPNSTTPDKSFHLFIPPSGKDAELRTIGTGTSWSYYTPSAFQYKVTRPGVRITGYGAHQALDKRSSLNTLQKTASSGGCATGRARAGAGTPVTASTCSTSTSPNFSTFAFTHWIEVDGCYRPTSGTERCATVHVPEPY